VRATAFLVAALIAGLGAGCGGEDEFAGSPDPASERNDPPAKPPPGWRTFANRPAGFTISVPPGWPARARGSATLIRSPERLLAVTVAADRSEAARTTPPREYARRTFHALPGFRDVKVTGTHKVARSPYDSARVDGAGTLAQRRQRQHITVAAFRRGRHATYAVVAFAAPAGRAPAHGGELDRLLASLRARRPAL
jgi:hypothetical protein